ncbi:MAG: hypothetical protein P4L51_04005 [Puia sp.]|nr:hypothetical protein [Puia sp.]
MILKDHLTNGYIINVAITAKQLFLATLRIAFVCLFIGGYPDV